MYANREVFPNAPLALVAVEVRFTDSPRLRQQQTLDAIAISLEGRFPFVRPLQEQVFQVNLGNPGPGFQPQLEQQQRVVLTNAGNAESLTIAPSSITYETTAYSEFDELSANVSAACEALIGAGVQPALLRVGLRYIDEVRVPQLVTDVREWGRWIDSSLVGPLAVGPDGVAVRNAQGLVTFDLGNGMGLNFQYAALPQGSVVEPQFLNRRPFKPGPFFVLDFDGFHEFTNGRAIPLDATVVTEILAAVHIPAGAAFQRAITDEARALFRRGDE